MKCSSFVPQYRWGCLDTAPAYWRLQRKAVMSDLVAPTFTKNVKVGQPRRGNRRRPISRVLRYPMELVFDLLKYVRDIFSLFIAGVIIFWSLRGQRFQWGFSPKGPPASAFLIRSWLLVGGTYAMWWGCVQFGLDSHLLTDRSRAVTLLAFVTNHVGRILIHLFLIVVFALFGISMARTVRAEGSATGN